MINEIWKDVVGWEDSYEVSNMGNVRSKERFHQTSLGLRKYGGNYLSPTPTPKGYIRVRLSNKGRKQVVIVNRLVLFAFVGSPESGFESCHNNGNPSDNRLENLRWDSRINNNKDKLLHNTLPVGEKSGTSKLTWDDIKDIREYRESHTVTAKKYGVSKSNIAQIRRGYSWRDKSKLHIPRECEV